MELVGVDPPSVAEAKRARNLARPQQVINGLTATVESLCDLSYCHHPPKCHFCLHPLSLAEYNAVQFITTVDDFLLLELILLSR